MLRRSRILPLEATSSSHVIKIKKRTNNASGSVRNGVRSTIAALTVPVV